jgi:hypothetical protein
MRDLENHMLAPDYLAAEDDRDGVYFCCECGARIPAEQVDPCDDFDELYCADCEPQGDEDGD